MHQIETDLYRRKGRTTNNFETTLPSPQSDLARQTLKDPYVFDFLTLSDKAREKDIKNALLSHITKFLLELGAGFAFIGEEYHLEISDHDYYIDLLFYHLELRCFVVIELKTGEFKPEFTGKINFYLSAVDAELKHDTDNPSIGIILCKTKDKVIAEYALRDIAKPIGISEYKIVKAIPKELKSSLPSAEEIESELSKADIKHVDKKNSK